MSDSKVRSQARIVMWLVTIPFAALTLLGLMLVGNIVAQAISGGGQLAGQTALKVAVYYLPMALYIWAIWMVRQALRSIVAGELFNRVVPKLLTRVGLALFCGGLFKEIGEPLVWLLVTGRPYLQTFEASAVTVAAIGLSLTLFAHLLSRAASMREELGQFI